MTMESSLILSSNFMLTNIKLKTDIKNATICIVN